MQQTSLTVFYRHLNFSHLTLYCIWLTNIWFDLVSLNHAPEQFCDDDCVLWSLIEKFMNENRLRSVDRFIWITSIDYYTQQLRHSSIHSTVFDSLCPIYCQFQCYLSHSQPNGQKVYRTHFGQNDSWTWIYFAWNQIDSVADRMFYNGIDTGLSVGCRLISSNYMISEKSHQNNGPCNDSDILFGCTDLMSD